MNQYEIRADYNKDSIVVYQAFNSAIAKVAAETNRFQRPFSMHRMTWIKPSFLWMMYRSGWGLKDAGQSRILAIDITREDPVRIVMDDTGGVGADLVVECSGSPEAILQAIGMVKRGGRVVLEGITGGKEIPVNTDRLILDEISLLGARGSPNCYPPSIQLIADGAVNARRMLTHEFPLEEIGRAMEMFKKREGNPLRVAVKP